MVRFPALGNSWSSARVVSAAELDNGYAYTTRASNGY